MTDYISYLDCEGNDRFECGEFDGVSFYSQGVSSESENGYFYVTGRESQDDEAMGWWRVNYRRIIECGCRIRGIEYSIDGADSQYHIARRYKKLLEATKLTEGDFIRWQDGDEECESEVTENIPADRMVVVEWRNILVEVAYEKIICEAGV